MCANWFPFHYRGVSGWRAAGLPLTASSGEAARCLDAAVAQLVLMDADPEFGGPEEALERARRAEPDMFMGRVMAAGFEAAGELESWVELGGGEKKKTCVCTQPMSLAWIFSDGVALRSFFFSLL